MLRINVVIPTRNRSKSVSNLVNYLVTFSEIESIIVVDSSEDKNIEIINKKYSKVKYLQSPIQSAAHQRNLGIESFQNTPKYLAFLDDDVWPDNNYFTKLTLLLKDRNAVGVSGITSDVWAKLNNYKPNRFRKFYQRIFLLDSKKECVVLPSGVNTAVKDFKTKIIEAEWLIGCSVWNYEIIKNLRFESDLKTHSIGEDVIFSMKASKYGELLVNKNVVLEHRNINLQKRSVDYFEQWIENRKKIVIIQQLGFKGKLSYLLANTGSSIYMLVQNFTSLDNFMKILLIYIRSWDVLKL